MNDTAIAAVRDYADALRAYCQCPQSVPTYYTATGGRTVSTSHEIESTLLPVTHRPIRGLAGVRVELVDAPRSVKTEPSALVSVLSEAIPFGASPPRSTADTPCAAERQSLYDAFSRVRNAIFTDGELALRLTDGTGYKTYEPSELRQHVAGQRSPDVPLIEVAALGDLFDQQLAAFGCTAASARDFDGWHLLAEGVIATLAELEIRQRHNYDACAYLNGPVCDFGDARLLAGHSPTADRSILIAQATDEDLSRMVEGYGYTAHLPLGLSNCNTVLRIPLSVPVLGTVAQFESLYPLAGELAARALDVVRIVYGEDIGISGLLVHSNQFAAPILRQTYHTRYNPSYGPYLPHRVAFFSVPDRPITEHELAESSSLLARHLVDTDVKGFPVALRRFRDTWERHWPDSEERLLDIAIALEALFLNDGEEKELSHRLALRVARFLEEAGPQRVATFLAVRQLYVLRSQVAHGASLQRGRARERKKLSATMVAAPAILRRVMQRIIEGGGPTGLDGDRLRTFWREIELR